jgi:uroporphyrinogen decarboxylase
MEPPERAILLDACRGETLPRPPVWIMRQAGRYLPEYRAMRSGHSFVEMCTRPELAVEISLQPYRRFRLDAVIVFYDILFLLEAMGAPLEFTDEGPVFAKPVASAADVEALHEPDLEEPAAGRGTGAVLATLRELRRLVPSRTAVLGFAGAPFTLAAYLLEGGFRKGGERIRRRLHEDPGMVHGLLERLAGSTGSYLAAQARAGASAVQLFDTWAGVLAPAEYREFALPYQKAVFEHLAAAADVPSILYVNGSVHVLEDLARSGAQVLSLDWRQSLAAARERLGGGVALQGNLDPAALFAPPAEVLRRTRAMLESMAEGGGDGVSGGNPGSRGYRGYIVNLGHGILPETPLASVEALVRAVEEASAPESHVSRGSAGAESSACNLPADGRH